MKYTGNKKCNLVLIISMMLIGSVVYSQTNTTGNRFKRVDYDYDLVSGNVKAVHYQSGQIDEMHHKYEYDEDNKITNVYTSKDSVIWDQDAKYFYFKHGPLARTELGNEKVQGMDYAYNLEGWIKGVNSNILNATNDIGRDGLQNSSIVNPNSSIAKDAFGYSLNYFNGDYKAIDPGKNLIGNSFMANLSNNTNVSNLNGLAPDAPNLFNGNINSMVTSIHDLTNPLVPVAKPQLTAYKYDQLNRIKQMKAFRDIDLIDNASNNGSGNNGLYETHLTYDANGNIKTLKRNGDNIGNVSMDDMTYTYETKANGGKTNKLIHVNDNVASNAYTTDIDDQGVFGINNVNYDYDEIGNLKSDKQEEIANIEWTVYGKIKSITRTASSIKSDLEFNYDASGNRISKTVKPHATLNDASTWVITYYVRDASGNVMSTYQDKESNSDFYLQEQSLYGSSRVGVLNRDFNLTTAGLTDIQSHTLGNKQFELSNHLGNVLSTVTDRKLAFDSNNNGIVDYFQPEITNVTDYGVFGDPLDGRKYANATGYRYGFNGKEKMDEVNGNGAMYDYGFRIYDPRLGRFLSVDPLTESYPNLTPYQFSANNPIRFTDLDGLEVNDPMPQYHDPVPDPQISNDNGGRNNNRFFDPQAGMGQRGERPHYGIDILAPVNTDLVSVMDGVVVAVVNTFQPGQYARNSYGNTVVIRGEDAAGNEIYVMYGHLNGVNVEVNAPVMAGAIIGQTGNTGNAANIGADNTHVHIEASTTAVFSTVNTGGGVGTRVNPEQFMQTQFDGAGNAIQNNDANQNGSNADVPPAFIVPVVNIAPPDATQVALPTPIVPPPAQQTVPVVQDPTNITLPFNATQ